MTNHRSARLARYHKAIRAAARAHPEDPRLPRLAASIDDAVHEPPSEPA